MLFSYNRLKKIANLGDVSIKEVVEGLNSFGFEVEDYYKWVPDNKVTIGKILTISKHPKADRLFILDIDAKKKFQIVTSATVYEGDHVAFFEPGAVVDGQELKTIEFFGVKSYGMLCSLSELGIPKSIIHDELKDEILTVDKSYPLGSNAIKELGLNDYIIDIDILSNRSDAKSYYVLSQELAAYFKTNWKYELPNETPTYKSNIKVVNGESNHLSFFEAKVDNIKRSKFEVELLLMKSNIKPINEIVDLTALTLVELNQPTHAYDKDTIDGVITVSLESGEKTFMDGKSYKFKNSLVIKDNNNIISIAGISGIPKYSITNETKNILFEIGSFSSSVIRTTLKTCKFFSESSNRFSKKINPNMINKAIGFLKKNLNSYTQTINVFTDIKKTVKYSEELMEKYTHKGILEKSVYKNAISKLKILGFNFDDHNKVIIPDYRHDISIEVDLIEEILRFITFAFLKPEPIKIHNTTNIVKKLTYKTEMAINGFNEVITHCLQSEKYNEFNPFNFKDSIKLMTYISLNRILYRNSLVPALIEVVNYNQGRKIEKIAIFEEGKVHGEVGDHLAIATNKHSFNDLKIIILKLIQQFGKTDFKRTTYKDLHPGVSADIYLNDKYIGFIGKTHPNYQESDVFIAELDLEKIEKIALYKQQFKEYYSNSYVVRDFTFKVDKQFDFINITKKINILESVSRQSIISEYQLNNNEISITIRVYFDKINTMKLDIEKIENLIK